MSMIATIMAAIRGSYSGGVDPDPPAEEYFDPVSGDIDFTDEHFWASLPGYDKASGLYQGRNTASYVEFRTSETSMDVKIAGDWQWTNTESDIEILVDGVYNQSVRLTATDTIQNKPITLPAGEKIVRIVNGYNADTASVVRPLKGVWVVGLITTGDVEIKVPVIPTNKWLFVGDSISTGATGTHPVITGYVGLIRNTVAEDGIEVASDSWGARRFINTNGTLTTQMATQIVEQMNGTETNELFLPLGTNNFGIEAASKSYFKGLYGSLLDEIHSQQPDIIIWCISILDRTSYDTPNVSGATGEDFADAVQELAVERAYCHFVYGRDLMDVANTTDGLHPNQTGHQEIHDNLLAAYNA